MMWNGRTSGTLTQYPSAVGYILSSVEDIRQTHDAQSSIARSNILAGEELLDSYGTKEDIPMRYVLNILEFPQGHLLIHSDDPVVEWHPRSMCDGRAIPVQSIYVDSDNVCGLALKANAFAE
jgi:hypothetical protein